MIKPPWRNRNIKTYNFDIVLRSGKVESFQATMNIFLEVMAELDRHGYVEICKYYIDRQEIVEIVGIMYRGAHMRGSMMYLPKEEVL